MITPAYSPTATERVLPRLALDFTTAITDPRVNTARAFNSATRFNSSGVIELVNANLPRYDFDPVTRVCKGQLIEESRTNLLLNSLIDGTFLPTQTITLSATPYTLSFYGTGTVVISGGASATVTGAGVFPTRTTYTFTPTAGLCIFTVSGSVQYAQLEAGSFATSFIPTAASAATRDADLVTMTGTNFTSWFNAAAGALFSEITLSNVAVSQGAWAIGDNSLGFGAGRMMYAESSPGAVGRLTFNVFNNGSQQVFMQPNVVPVVGTPIQSVFAYKSNDYAASVSASSPSTGGGAIPAVTGMSIGSLAAGWSGATQYMNGHVRKIFYWPQRLINAEVQAFSK